MKHKSKNELNSTKFNQVNKGKVCVWCACGVRVACVWRARAYPLRRSPRAVRTARSSTAPAATRAAGAVCASDQAVSESTPSPPHARRTSWRTEPAPAAPSRARPPNSDTCASVCTDCRNTSNTLFILSINILIQNFHLSRSIFEKLMK